MHNYILDISKQIKTSLFEVKQCFRDIQNKKDGRAIWDSGCHKGVILIYCWLHGFCESHCVCEAWTLCKPRTYSYGKHVGVLKVLDTYLGLCFFVTTITEV